MFRLFFVATLNIYRDYFKGHHNRYKSVKLDAKVLFKQIVTGDKFVLVHLSLEEAAALVRHRVLQPMSFMIFIVLMN